MNEILVDRIRHAIINPGGEAHLDEINAEVKRISDKKLTGAWEASIRGELHRHSSDSDSLCGRGDHFYPVEGKGKGVRGVRDMTKPKILTGTTPFPRTALICVDLHIMMSTQILTPSNLI